jgi:hypothetical protein
MQIKGHNRTKYIIFLGHKIALNAAVLNGFQGKILTIFVLKLLKSGNISTGNIKKSPPSIIRLGVTFGIL